jgi:tubulin-specific chaperone A
MHRILKEYLYNISETEKQNAKVEGMVAASKDEFDIKKQREVLEECRMMIPDSRSRLKESVTELEKFVEEVKEVEGVKDSDALPAAVTVLDEVKAALTK